MFPKFRTISLALALTIPVAAHAQRTAYKLPPSETQRWALAAEGEASGMRVYIDTQTMTRDGSRVTVWVRDVYRGPVTNSLGTNFWSSVTLTVFDCAARTEQGRDWATFTEDGTVSKNGNYNMTAFAVMPGSIAEGTLETVCNWRR